MTEHCWHGTGHGTQYANYPSSGGTEGVQCCRCGLSTTLRYSNERSHSTVEGHGPHLFDLMANERVRIQITGEMGGHA